MPLGNKFFNGGRDLNIGASSSSGYLPRVRARGFSLGSPGLAGASLRGHRLPWRMRKRVLRVLLRVLVLCYRFNTAAPPLALNEPCDRASPGFGLGEDFVARKSTDFFNPSLTSSMIPSLLSAWLRPSKFILRIKSHYLFFWSGSVWADTRLRRRV